MFNCIIGVVTISRNIFIASLDIPQSYLILLISVIFFSLLAAIIYLGEKYVKARLNDVDGGESSSTGKSCKKVSLSKGYDIKIKGQATGEVLDYTAEGSRYAIRPTDIKGMSPIPKLVVQVGSEVKAGDVLFYDKKKPEVMYVSPVSGEIIEVNRGEKRMITEVVVLADKEQKYKQFSIDLNASREDLVADLLTSGAWSLIRQRPYDRTPDVDVVPRDIFVSTFDTAPLAPNSSNILAANQADFEKGIELLSKLTSGKVNVGISANASNVAPSYLTELEYAKVTSFAGKHPAGNVGVQIHHTSPINKGDTVWTVGYQDVIVLGKLINKGIYSPERVISVAGPTLDKPFLAKAIQGVSIASLLPEVAAGERIISGDVLTGTQVGANDSLGFYHDQVSVLEEGDSYELFGWLMPLTPRPSISNTFPGFAMPSFEYAPTTNTHGEKRAFVVTGQYEEVLPMDIFPQHLLKSILVNDIERMEGLGIYEVIEEDLALCEFVCTSKQNVQQIISQGIETMIEQG